jgi:hypothetical protein
MWKWLAALPLLATSAVAQEQATAYEALRAVGRQLNRDSVNHIISVTGAKGNPQPDTWRILIDDPATGMREIEVRSGHIESDHPGGAVAGSRQGATIKTNRLNLDSSGAFAVASHTADKSGTHFDAVSYTLRNDEHGEPLWIVTLYSRVGRPVGTIYIGANRGTVTRTEGMFAGTNMEDVETERDVERSRENRGGIINEAKARIRETFQRAQDEARDTFERVRHSFVDFLNGD